MAEVQLIDILDGQICYVLLCTYCCILFQNMAILPSSDLWAVRGWRTGWWWWRWAAKSLSGCNLSCSVTWEPRHHHEYTRPPPYTHLHYRFYMHLQSKLLSFNGVLKQDAGKAFTVICSALDHANSNTYCSIVPVELCQNCYL